MLGMRVCSQKTTFFYAISCDILHTAACPPAFPTHLHCRTATMLITLKKILWNLPEHCVYLSFQFMWSLGYVLANLFLSSSSSPPPHHLVKKSRGVMPGLLGDHSIRRRRSSHLSGDFSSSHCETGVPKWGSAPCCSVVSMCYATDLALCLILPQPKVGTVVARKASECRINQHGTQTCRETGKNTNGYVEVWGISHDMTRKYSILKSFSFTFFSAFYTGNHISLCSIKVQNVLITRTDFF
jgi:hypothetical protein